MLRKQKKILKGIFEANGLPSKPSFILIGRTELRGDKYYNRALAKWRVTSGIRVIEKQGFDTNKIEKSQLTLIVGRDGYIKYELYGFERELDKALLESKIRNMLLTPSKTPNLSSQDSEDNIKMPLNNR